MNFEFDGGNVRFLTPIKEEPNDWIYVLDALPKHGEKVKCYGNKTCCCDIDMDPAAEHIATFYIEEYEWQLDEEGNKINVKMRPCFHLDQDENDCPFHLVFVSRWKRI